MTPPKFRRAAARASSALMPRRMYSPASISRWKITSSSSSRSVCPSPRSPAARDQNVRIDLFLLFLPQRDRRIDAQRPQGRDEVCEQGHEHEDGRGRPERDRIVRVDAEEQRPEEPHDEERCCQADGQPDRNGLDAAAENEAQDVTGGGTE